MSGVALTLTRRRKRKRPRGAQEWVILLCGAYAALVSPTLDAHGVAFLPSTWPKGTPIWVILAGDWLYCWFMWWKTPPWIVAFWTFLGHTETERGAGRILREWIIGVSE